MSEFIELKNAKEIRQWREAHRPETGMKVESLREILEAPKTSHELDKQSEESTYYGVQHLLYTIQVVVRRLYACNGSSSQRMPKRHCSSTFLRQQSAVLGEVNNTYHSSFMMISIMSPKKSA